MKIEYTFLIKSNRYFLDHFCVDKSTIGDSNVFCVGFDDKLFSRITKGGRLEAVIILFDKVDLILLLSFAE